MTMKLFNVITTIEFGGAEKQLLIQSRELVTLGVDVTVVPLKGELQLAEHFRQAGISVNLELHELNPLFQVFRLSKLLKREKDAITHAHLPRSEMITWLSVIFSKSQFFVTRHNSEAFVTFFPRSLSSFFSRLILRRAKEIIAISHSVSKYLLKKREIPMTKSLQVIHYCYDPGILIEPPKYLFSAVPTKFISVARLERQKSLDTLLRAFALYRNTYGVGQLDLYGTGTQLDDLLELSENLKVKDFVQFMGKVENISVVLANYDCLFLTSRYEGFGLVLLEAMQKGLPIICSDAEAIREVLGSSYRGFFCVDSTFSLFEKMAELQNSDFYNSISQYGSERLKLFTPMRTISKLTEAYERA